MDDQIIKHAWAPVISIRVVAWTVLCKANKYLLVQEKFEKFYGLRNLPAGRVDEWETIAQTAVRETLEETWFQIELWKLLHVYHEKVSMAIKYAYEWIIIWGNLIFDVEELLDAQWFDLNQIQIMHQSWKLRGSRIYPALLQYEASKIVLFQ